MKLLLLAFGKPLLAAAGLSLGTYNAKISHQHAEIRLLEAAELQRAAEAQPGRVGAAIGRVRIEELDVQIVPAEPKVEVEVIPAAPVLPVEPKEKP